MRQKSVNQSEAMDLARDIGRSPPKALFTSETFSLSWMNKRPKEVFILIASFLGLRNKVQLALVCQKWDDTLLNANLYSTLTF